MTGNVFTLRTVCIPDKCTLGELYLPDGSYLCKTVERPWINNEQMISCIPAGDYAIINRFSAKYGDHYALANMNVNVSVNGPSHRTVCLIHSANYPSQVNGCIAPGMNWMPDKWGVSRSKDAVELWEEEIKKVEAEHGRNNAILRIKRLEL